ncbi:MAG: XRE family transcriptional regulator [Erysipelotrichaceae bacterium]|nr:XRE family transcriptional regulator [Erysipelotrichaceae bacterium]
MEIGKRIKQLRTRNNLTLEELASRCELTKGFLSQLERDLTSPSITTLADIVEALGLTMTEFFKDEKNEKIVFGKEDFFVDHREGLVINWIVPNAQKNEMEPILIELSPHQTSQIISPHEGEEFGYVLAGKVVLYNGDKKHVIKKGNTFYIKGNDSHYLKNETNQIASVLWICTPPIF